MRHWLKKIRAERGLSQAEVARALNLTQNYYSMIESGQRMQELPLDIAQKIANLFGITLEQVSRFETETKEG